MSVENGDSGKDNAVLCSMIEKLNQRIQEQLLEIVELHKKNTVIYKEFGMLEEEVTQARNKADDLKKSNERLDQMNRKMAPQLAEYKKNIDELASKIYELKNALNESIVREKDLEKRINQIENSKSWKWTKPLRMILYYLKEDK